MSKGRARDGRNRPGHGSVIYTDASKARKETCSKKMGSGELKEGLGC